MKEVEKYFKFAYLEILLKLYIIIGIQPFNSIFQLRENSLKLEVKQLLI